MATGPWTTAVPESSVTMKAPHAADFKIGSQATFISSITLLYPTQGCR